MNEVTETCVVITDEDIKKYPNDFSLGEFIRKKFNQKREIKFKEKEKEKR